MVQKLEAINGVGGSIKVGTKGTIGSLMTRELDSIKTAHQTTASFRHKSQTIPISVPCSSATPKRLQLRKSLDRGASVTSRDLSSKPRLADKGTVHQADCGTSTSGGSNSMSYKRPQTVQKITMLSSENVVFDRTPSRQKSGKKVSNIVEVVDIKCGHSDSAWASPITNRLKKLGFSKLSGASSRPTTPSHQILGFRISGSYSRNWKSQLTNSLKFPPWNKCLLEAGLLLFFLLLSCYNRSCNGSKVTIR